MFSDYGKIVRKYNGKGKMTFDSQYDTKFEIVQISNGNVYVLCKIDYPISTDIIGQQISLVGNTNSGKNVAFSGTCARYKCMVNKVNIVAYGSYVEIGYLPDDKREISIVFGLTNLKMQGSDSFEYKEAGQICYDRQYCFKLDDYDVYIRKVPNYSDVVNNLKRSKGIDVSCTAVIQIDSVESVEAVKKIMNNLCYLLTLAKGCKINWIFYDIFFENTCIFSRHEERITKSFCTLQLIATEPCEDLEFFIHKTYNEFISVRKVFEMDKAIDQYTDAKIESDYLEFRALKLAVTMEHIKCCFLRNENREYIIDNDKFKSNKSRILPEIKSVLRSEFSDEEPAKIDIMTSHAQGINNYPFGRALSDLFKKFGMHVNSEEKSKYLELRNNLVHRVSFTAGSETYWLQYCFLMTFIGKILLSIIGYDGYFCDWTKHSIDYEGENMKMRIKLDKKK